MIRRVDLLIGPKERMVETIETEKTVEALRYLESMLEYFRTSKYK